MGMMGQRPKGLRPGQVSFKGVKRLVKASFKEECDINRIVERSLAQGGVLPPPGAGVFADVSELGSYQDALNLVILARQEFAKLSSKIRDRFLNKPELLLKFLEDPANVEEAISLGLMEKKEVRPEPKVPAVAAVPPVVPPAEPAVEKPNA